MFQNGIENLVLCRSGICFSYLAYKRGGERSTDFGGKFGKTHAIYIGPEKDGDVPNIVRSDQVGMDGGLECKIGCCSCLVER